MLKINFIILILVLMFSKASIAEEFSFELGAGAPYGGLIGAQFSYTENKHKVRFSAGFIGVVVGYDYLINKKCTVGASIIKALILGDEVSKSIGFSCAFGKHRNHGWNYGVEVLTWQSDYSVNGDNRNLETKLLPSISIGYAF